MTGSCLKTITAAISAKRASIALNYSKSYKKGQEITKNPLNFQFQLIEGTKSFQPRNDKTTLMATIFLEGHSTKIWQ